VDLRTGQEFLTAEHHPGNGQSTDPALYRSRSFPGSLLPPSPRLSGSAAARAFPDFLKAPARRAKEQRYRGLRSAFPVFILEDMVSLIELAKTPPQT